MAKFDPKRYKVDTTPLSRLSRLNTAHLESVLTEWSRIGNQRAKRMKKLDPMYSSLLYMDEGGRFGKSGVYKDRISVIHELQRIKEIAPSLKKKHVENEALAIKGVESTLEEPIPEQVFRGAFASFKRKHGYVAPKIYQMIKAVITKMSKMSFSRTEAVIERLYNEYSTEIYEKYEEDTLPDDALPW